MRSIKYADKKHNTVEIPAARIARKLNLHQMNQASYPIDYETIFLHAPVGMCVSLDRVIQSCNHALAAMFGHARANLVGQSFQLLYPTLDEFLRTGERIIP